MDIQPASPTEPDDRTRRFYVECMRALDAAQIPYVVGGGYAMAYYTGIARNTKDLDLFLKPDDRDRALSTLGSLGYRTEFFYPFWIAKAIEPQTEAFIDILYSSGNGICTVDDDWIRHSESAQVLGYPTRLVPPEEQLWSKAFVQDRDRFDGADVNHLILARGQKFDWKRLLRRFEGHERVLLAHIVLFGYAYPTERDVVPAWVMERLMDALRDDSQDKSAAQVESERVCFGTNLAQRSYGTALREWGFADGRLQPRGPLGPDELAQLPEP